MSCIKRTLTIWMKFPLMNYLKVYLDMGCFADKMPPLPFLGSILFLL